MAELTVFNFKPGKSVIHRLDVRFKLVFLIVISLASLRASWLSLFLLTLVLVAVLIDAGLSLKPVMRALGYVFVLLFFIFVARAMSTPGDPFIEFKFISVSREGIHDGGLVCWRFLIVVMIGLCFVSTTRPAEIKAATEWFLNPIPFIPEKKVATMMSLVMRFIPVILNQARETADAQRARGVENRKNPVYRLKKLGIPLTRRTFETAEKIAIAMEARCYSENRSDPELSTHRRDWLAFFLVICLCTFIVVM